MTEQERKVFENNIVFNLAYFKMKQENINGVVEFFEYAKKIRDSIISKEAKLK